MDRKVCAAHHRENHVKVTGGGGARPEPARGRARKPPQRRRRTRLLPRKGLPSAGGNKRLRLKPGSRKPSTMSDAARLQSVPQRSALAKLSVPTSTKLPWRAGSQFDHTRGMATSTTGIIT